MITNDFVSVIVTGRNASRTICECLRSILSQDYPIDKFEIIYVDGESTDGTMDIVKKLAMRHRNIRWFVQDGLPGKGRNKGIVESKGQIVAFTDTDCQADKEWLKNIVAHLAESNDAVGIGGPAITPKSDVGIAGYIGSLWETRFGIGGARNPALYKGVRYVPHNPTCNSAYRKYVFDTVGLFNENLPVTEDEELDTRICRSGYKLLYSEDIVVYHQRKATVDAFARQMYSFGFWRAQSGKKNAVPLKYWHLGPSAFVLYLLFLPLLARTINSYVVAIPLLAYCGVALLSGTWISLKKMEFADALIVPALGFIQHISYGIGFIVGLIVDRRF
jgi:glycosyltransferase involved in cell wall biosynthesis